MTPPIQGLPERVIYLRRDRMLLFFLGIVGVVCFRLFWPSSFGKVPPELDIAALAAAIITPYLGYRLLVRRPALVLNDQGILDHASAAGVGFIAWEEIEKVFLHRYGPDIKLKYLGIVPRDPKAIMARQGLARKLTMKLSPSVGLPAPINIPLVNLSIEQGELLEELNRRLQGTGLFEP